MVVLVSFLQQESLSGNNQYFCSSCGSKQDAKRFIQLKTVPPVLTLQLMRFVFDMCVEQQCIASFSPKLLYIPSKCY